VLFDVMSGLASRRFEVEADADARFFRQTHRAVGRASVFGHRKR
jgi:hypothetical protein